MLSFSFRYLPIILLICSAGLLQAQERKIENELTVDQRRSLQEEARLVISILQSNHMSKRGFHELDASELLYFYLEHLDPEGMIFNERQVTFLVKRFERSLKASYLSKGDVYPAFEIFNSFNKNARKRIEWIQARLDEPFDLEGDDVYTSRVDDEGSSWPKNKREANRRWESYLTYQLVNELLVEDDREKAIEAIRDRYDSFGERLDEFDPMAIRELFLNMVMGLFDPHSGYSSWESHQEMMIGMEGSLVGIGADVATVDGVCVIQRIIPGGPADLNGGFYEGDHIVSIKQQGEKAVEIFGLRLREIIQMLRGEAGTEVTLEIVSPGSEYKRTIALERDQIDMAASRCKAYLFELPGETSVRKVGVINIPQFYASRDEDSEFSVTGDVRILIDKLNEQGMEALVLDVRQNPGGFMPEAIALVGLFIDEGPAVMIEDGSGHMDVLYDEVGGVSYSGPLAVLISNRSASASEILAGSLSDYKRAIVVGHDSTYGKGTMQSVRDMTDRQNDNSNEALWGGVRTTTAMFFTVGGSSTQNKGAPADIAIRFAKNPNFQSERDLPHALNWREVESQVPENLEEFYPEGTYILDDDSLASIQAAYQSREESLPEFLLWNQAQDFHDERYGKTEFSLNIAQRRAERDERLELTQERMKEWRALAKELAYPYTIIRLDNEEAIVAERQAGWVDAKLPDGRSRANRFYRNTFYWQENEGGPIVDISVRDLNYGTLRPMADGIMEGLTGFVELQISKKQLVVLIDELGEEAFSGELDCREILEEISGQEVSDELSNDFFTVLFSRIVSIDTDLVHDYSLVDIALRESMRNVIDWLELAD